MASSDGRQEGDRGVRDLRFEASEAAMASSASGLRGGDGVLRVV